MTEKLLLSDEEWKQRLTPEEYRVLRQHGTEAPGSGCFLGTSLPTARPALLHQLGSGKACAGR